jgi:4-coumarate--CoA ligase
MTELTSISHYPHLIDAKFKQGAVGKLGPNLELKIVCPETGEELRLDKLGEICIRGPIVMTGYLNNDEATKSIIDSKGFLHTGNNLI